MNISVGWVVEFWFIYVRVAFPINWVLHCIKLGCFGCCSGWLMKCPGNILDVSLKLPLAFSLPASEWEGALKCVHWRWTLKYMLQDPLSFFLERKTISTKQEIKPFRHSKKIYILKLLDVTCRSSQRVLNLINVNIMKI